MTATPPEPEPTLESVEAEFPRWHAFDGVNGTLHYAWWRGSSPPVVVRGETWAEVREAIRDVLGSLE
ncbi:MAG TPA: hypothetical protein VGA04_09300 [Streptosporangiaceae bacterium]